MTHNGKVIDFDPTKFETDRWVFTISRKLTPDEMKKVRVLMSTKEVAEKLWDKAGNEFSMPVTLWCVKQVCPDVEVREWHAEPMMILVRGLYLPQKVYEIRHAMHFADAAKVAKQTWREQFPLGIEGTILSARVATEKDLKKMTEIPEDDEG